MSLFHFLTWYRGNNGYRVCESDRKRNKSENEAIAILYGSFLYSKLENEKTKIWHLSILALLEMLEEELKTGKIEFPKEV